MAFLGEIRPFCNIHFSYGDREGQNSCNKLPKYCCNITHDVEQGDLNGTNTFHCLHYMPKGPECEEHGVEAVQIACHNKSPVVGHGRREGPRDYSKNERH